MIITRYAIRFRTAVFVMVFNLIIAGLMSFSAMPREMTPDIQIPVIVVSVPYPGASPIDVEQLILTPVEKELKGLKDISKLSGAAYEGAAVVTIEFTPEANIDESLQSVRDRVSRVRPTLPADIRDPEVKEVSFSDFPVLIVNISGAYSPERLKRFAEGLQEDIESIPGVLAANLSGGVEEQFRINVDPELAQASGVSLVDVVNAIKSENINLPGGLVEVDRTSYLLRTPAEFRTAGQLAEIIVKAPNNRPVRLTDVATIERGFVKPTSYARINKTPCVSVQVTKRTGANIIDVVDRTKEAVQKHAALAPTGTEIKLLNDQSVVIRDMVDDLVNNIITGLVLVVAVIFFFMGARNAMLVSIAVPLSMLLTFITLDLMGVTLNMVTLFALILALGMLVDNAIVIVENIYRHLGERVKPGDDASVFRRLRMVAAFTGTAEVAWPVIASTATTVAAFAPLLFWPGIMGKFMGYMPLVVIITLISSLVVGLVINPVMAAVFMARPSLQGAPDVMADDWELAFAGPLSRAYGWTLRQAIDFKRRQWFKPLLIMLGSVAALVLSIAAFVASDNGVEFFPETTPKRATISITAPNGTHLGGSDRIVRQVEGVLGELPNVADFVATPGASAAAFKMGGGAANAHLSGVSIDFRDEGDRVENTMVTIDKMRARFDNIAGARLEVQREKMGPPSGAPISVRLKGAEYDVLGRLSAQLIGVLDDMHKGGVADPKTDYVTGRPELQVLVDRQAAREVGASTSAVATAIRNAFNGNESSVIRDGIDEYDIIVRHAAGRRDSPSDLADVKVPGKDGVLIPLEQLTRVVRTSGSGTIRHWDTDRVVTIDADVSSGANANKLREDLAVRLDKELELPAGYSWAFGGENEEQKKAQKFLGNALLFGLFAILLILVTQFNSLLKPVIILSSVVLSLIGVFAGLIITGTPFGVIMTGLGVISLAGVVVNNAIVLIDFIEQLRSAGLSAHEAVLRAGMTRLRPVILTATTTILGLVPMAMGWSIDFLKFEFRTGSSSGEFWGAMAVAVIFGLLFATALTLVAVPALYLLLDGIGSFVRRRLFGSDDAAIDLDIELERDARVAGAGHVGATVALLMAIVVGSGIALPNEAVAQAPSLALHEGADVKTYDLKGLLAVFNKQAPDLKVARERLTSASLIVDRAWGALHPQITASGGYTLNDPVIELQFADPVQVRQQAQGTMDAHIADLKVVREQLAASGQQTGIIDSAIGAQQKIRDDMPLPDIPPVQLNKRHALSASIRLQMSIYDARTFDGLKMARATAKMAREELNLTQNALMHAVARAYAGAALQRESLAVMQSRVVAAKRELEATDKRLTAGVGTALGRKIALLQVIQAERGSAGAALAYHSAIASLGLIVGIDERFDVQGQLVVRRPTGPESELVAQGLRKRAEVQLLAHQSRLANLQTNETWKRWLPRLSLVGQSQWSNVSGFAGTNVTSMLMVQLTQQIWDGGISGIDRRQNEAMRRQIAVQKATIKAQIAAQVRGAARRIAVLEKDAVAVGEALAVSEAAVKDAEAGVAAGANTELELRGLQDRVVETRLAVLQAATSLSVAVLELRRTVGLAPL